jgi:hypothetical protein
MRVRTDSLHPAPWNPAIRTQTKYTLGLRESIQTNGFWEFRPILTDRNGMIIDGHRRWTAAKALGIFEIPAIVVDADADKLWSEVNGQTMAISGAQVVQAVAGGLQTIPDKFDKNMTRLVEIMGNEGVQLLAANNMGPNVVAFAERVGRYCKMTEDREFLQKTIRWLVTHRDASGTSQRAMKDNVAPSRLYKAILDNRLLEIRYE